VEEAASVLNLLAQTFNFAEYEGRTKAIAVQKGYAVTLAGRKRYFDLPDRSVMSQWEFRKRIGEIERAALNHPIQGTNADITKLAMVWAAEALKPFGGKLVMSIHDELVAWAPEGVAEEAAAAMGEAMLAAEREFLHSVEAGIDGGVRNDWSH
jgi:DNA polymerase I-like protein with 3'-5' exonuclease and polymerase domains